MQGRELKQARSLQQDDVQIGSYRVVSVEVYERERCFLDEFAISAPLNTFQLFGSVVEQAGLRTRRMGLCNIMSSNELTSVYLLHTYIYGTQKKLCSTG